MQAIKDSLKVEVDNCANCRFTKVGVSKDKKRNTIHIKLEPEHRLTKAELTVSFEEQTTKTRVLAQSTRKFFKILPISTEPFDTENHYQRTSLAFSIIFKAAHLIIFKVIIMMLNFSISVHFHICLSFFTVLRLINGPYFGLATWWTNLMSSSSYFGFLRQNFVFNEQSDNCDLDPALISEGVSCSIAENYLMNIVILGCMFVIGLVIQYIFRNSLHKLFKPKTHFALRWPLLMVYGSTYELMAYSMVNFIYMHKSGLAIAGLVLSIISTGLLVAIGIYLWTLRGKDFENPEDLEAVFCLPREAPIITLLRYVKMILVGIAAAGMIKTHVAQPIVILFFELCYIGVLLFNRNRWINEQLYIDAFYGSANCVVLILRAITFSKMGYDSTVKLGIVVFLLLLANLIIVLGWSVIKLIPEWMCKSMRRLLSRWRKYGALNIKCPKRKNQRQVVPLETTNRDFNGIQPPPNKIEMIEQVKA